MSTDLETAARRMSATFTVAQMRKAHPELVRAEAEARLDLVAAILEMDDAANRPGHHNFNEQLEVERKSATYAQALANLVRGALPEDNA